MWTEIPILAQMLEKRQGFFVSENRPRLKKNRGRGKGESILHKSIPVATRPSHALRQNYDPRPRVSERGRKRTYKDEETGLDFPLIRQSEAEHGDSKSASWGSRKKRRGEG